MSFLRHFFQQLFRRQHNKPANPECMKFSRVFLPELHAIQARRRRYRIEQLLGSLPPDNTELKDAYDQILKCETEIDKHLDEYLKAENSTRVSICVALCQSMLELAKAEETLFEKAVKLFERTERKALCEKAKVAAKQEVERASKEVENALVAKPPAPLSSSDGGGTAIEPPDDFLDVARRMALGGDLVGLALSGGGIRSATFALGVLQGLAQLRLLGMVDYLSTVSGGGYIGSWFAAWVKREGSLGNVERQLSPDRVSQAAARRLDPITGDPLAAEPRDAEPEPVHHLRAYSRYLSPRFSPFSPDTWTLFTIYLRNLFVNALFLVPLAVLLVFLWRVLLHGYDLDWLPWRVFTTVVFLIAYLVAAGFLFWAQENLFEAAATDERKKQKTPPSQPAKEEKAESLRAIHLGIIFPLLLMATIGPWIFSVDASPLNLKDGYDGAHQLRFFGQGGIEEYGPKDAIFRFALFFGVIAVILSLIIRLVRLGMRGGSDFNWRGLCSNLVLALFFGVFLYLVMSFVIWPLSFRAAHDLCPDLLCLLHTVSMPLVLASMVLAGFAEMGLTGWWLKEYEREWRSRLSAYLLMWATAWLAMAGAALYLPWLLEKLFHWFDGPDSSAPTVVRTVLTALWAAISGGGAWAARRTGATDPQRRSWWVRPLLTIAPLVFLAGLAAGISGLGQRLIDSSALTELWAFLTRAEASESAGTEESSSSFLVGVTHDAVSNWALIGIAFVAAYIFNLLIRVNRFSMHMLYNNRLTRCYLGASRRKQIGSLGAPTGVPPSDPIRQRNLFTGLDPQDDFPLAELSTINEKNPYTGPLPLINCALNCLAGDELAHQDRRADAFVLTPKACGGGLTGFASTPTKKGARNLTLGRAMTISGAAVDPSMSGLSSPLAALMTILNTRLGWWMENPHPDRRPWRQKGAPWGAREPGVALPLLWEFIGLTNEYRSYVHLSDGGHFENLGVYELIRRRCRFIIVVDAGTDRLAASDNMAAMLRLVRTDFGIRIQLDPAQMQEDSQGRSKWHCAVGHIRYDEVDQAAVPGLLIYLQATLTGDEPADLLQYVACHPHFPRQSTLNQFFDEAQFECYRVLGYHTATQVFGHAAAAWSGQVLNPSDHQAETRAVFAAVQEQWFPPPPCSETEWIAASRVTLQLDQQLANNPDLIEFSGAAYPELCLPPIPESGVPSALTKREVQEFRAVSQTLQVMELSWAAMKLARFHAHPSNRGWMNTFRRWTSSASFHKYWPFLRAEYSKLFVRFCENVLNLQSPHVEAVRSHELASDELQKKLEELGKQFGYEWSDAFAHLRLPEGTFKAAKFLAGLAANPREDSAGKPLLWFLFPKDNNSKDNNLPSYCCGIVCVSEGSPRLTLLRPSSDTNEEAEFFVWLRGPYRTLGIGTEALRHILQQIEDEAASISLQKLTVYYPLQTAGSGNRLELERWMDFFFDQGFRRIKQPDIGVGAKFAVLTRELNPRSPSFLNISGFFIGR